MKDFRAKVKIYNNRLVQRRLDLGMTQQQLADAAMVPLGSYQALETMRLVPVDGRNGGPSHNAKRLMSFYDCGFEDLFPESIFKVVSTEICRDFNIDEISGLMAADGSAYLPATPDEIYDERATAEALRDSLDTLSPREQQIISLRFFEDKTLEDAGSALDPPVLRERARQIEAKALRKLRHNSRSKKLRSCLTGQVFEKDTDGCHE